MAKMTVYLEGDRGALISRSNLELHFERPKATERRSSMPVEIDFPLRPEVLAFARLMEAKLRTHDHDRGRQGWKDDDPKALYDRLLDEVKELAFELWNKGTADEAVDVANFAMMIADVVGGLK